MHGTSEQQANEVDTGKGRRRPLIKCGFFNNNTCAKHALHVRTTIGAESDQRVINPKNAMQEGIS